MMTRYLKIEVENIHDDENKEREFSYRRVYSTPEDNWCDLPSRLDLIYANRAEQVIGVVDITQIEFYNAKLERIVNSLSNIEKEIEAILVSDLSLREIISMKREMEDQYLRVLARLYRRYHNYLEECPELAGEVSEQVSQLVDVEQKNISRMK